MTTNASSAIPLNPQVTAQLKAWATEYHNPKFIANDPVQFPHRYTYKCDIETSGLLTALMSFGNRKQILLKADLLDGMMQGHPHEYVLSTQWHKDFPEGEKKSFYRMLSYDDMHHLFARLHKAYLSYPSLEDALLSQPGSSPMDKLCVFMEVSNRSPQKKLNMFLRWMIRQGSEVDFGIWTRFSSKDLIIPLDTHVCRVAYELGLIPTQTFSLNNAHRITEALAQVFPDDPCLGDFALFGYGVSR